MDAVKRIEDAQKAWAESNGISFCSKGYVCDVEANLWKPLSAHARRGFERGAGSEPTSHMRALHSSSALAANFFDYWTDRDRDKGPLLSGLGVDADGAESLNFEERFPTGLRGTPPHLDVAIGLSSGCVIAVECKFTEHLKPVPEGKSEFSASYFPSSGEGLWTRRGLPQCQALAEELYRNRCLFEFLDPWQLLKHALGLAKKLGVRFGLYYLYYDCLGGEADAHRSEVERFTCLVGAEVRFSAVTYQDVFAKLKDNQLDPGYLDYLEGRYFPIKGSC